MRRALRILLAFLTIVIGTAAIRNEVARYRENVLIRRVETRTKEALELPSRAQRRAAIQNLRALEQGTTASRNVEFYMVEAANLRLLNRLQEAEEGYCKALRVSRRPEIYFNLATLRLEQGDLEQAIQLFAVPVRFWADNILLVPPSQRERVLAAAEGQTKLPDPCDPAQRP